MDSPPTPSASGPPPPNDRRPRPLLVVSLEGLATTGLGCYGSSWSQTPSIDRVASSGAVWDRLIASETVPLEVLRGWIAPGGPGSWQRRCREIGSLELITDDRAVADPGFSDAFDRVVLVEDDGDPEPRGEPKGSAANLDMRPAESPEETGFAQLIAAATERVTEPECSWGAIWLHSRFLTRCWDAPRDLVSHDEWEDDGDDDPQAGDAGEQAGDADRIGHSSPVLTAERVPPVFSQTVPPRIRLERDSHPDLVTSWMRTYACQVRLADLLVGFLRESLAKLDPVVVVAGTSGFGLGQNGWIGHACGPLRSGQIRLPLIIGAGTPIRSHRVTPATELPTILAKIAGQTATVVPVESWAGADDEFEPSVVTRDAGDGSRFGVTTGRWFLASGPEAGGPEADGPEEESLFFKPDDVDDVNDVGRLRPDVVERIREIVSGESIADTKKTSP